GHAAGPLMMGVGRRGEVLERLFVLVVVGVDPPVRGRIDPGYLDVVGDVRVPSLAVIEAPRKPAPGDASRGEQVADVPGNERGGAAPVARPADRAVVVVG